MLLNTELSNRRHWENKQIEFNDLAEDAEAADNITKHMARLYLKELHLVNNGPGFPSCMVAPLPTYMSSISPSQALMYEERDASWKGMGS